MKKKERIFSSEDGPKKVGRFYKNIDGEFGYSDVKFDENKWADVAFFLPGDFDLCHCKIEGKDRIYAGWHAGTTWDGANIKPDFNVLAWKLNYDT